jgi:Tfp pilus assembly protein PilV
VSKRAGYSVFEVLIAFAIMAMVLSALLPGQAKLLARATASDDKILAYDFALSRLAQLAVAQPLEAGNSTTEEGDWKAVESVIAVAEENATRFDLSVSIETQDGRELARAASSRWVLNE